ncbi:carbohydrate esterase [Abditibacteriota bacterium]|nr:carbohydrate esterase [Abditibacteriota bacterium]
MKRLVVVLFLLAIPFPLRAQQTVWSEKPTPIMPIPDVQQLPFIKELPDPFDRGDGQRIKTQGDWKQQRERLKALLLFYQYGHLPPPPGNVRQIGVYSRASADGRARHEHILLSCGPRGGLEFSLDLLVPQNKMGPFPVILTGDMGETPIPDEVVGRGYILARFDRTRFAPDTDSRVSGLYGLYPDFDGGALAAWAWGYSRAVDYLLTRPDIDSKRIAFAGHSRGGKAVLLAGALDDRIALTVPAQSGTGGASPYRIGGKNSESLAKITGRFGYWFHPRLKSFVGREERLPFDQHFLLSLVAPRSLLMLSGRQDPYMNPDSTNASFLAAKQVFGFLRAENKIGSYVRDGGHSFGEADWRVMLDFADLQFFGQPTSTNFEGLPVAEETLPFSWRAPRF